MTSVDEILYAPIQPAEEATVMEGLETVSLAELVDQGAEAYYHTGQNQFALAQSVYRDCQNRFALANLQGLGSLANLNVQLQGLGQNLNQQAQNLQGLAYQSQMNMPQGWRNPTTFEQAIRQIEALIS